MKRGERDTIGLWGQQKSRSGGFIQREEGSSNTPPKYPREGKKMEPVTTNFECITAAGLDWLTFTSQSDLGTHHLYQVWTSNYPKIADEGEPVLEWKGMGYHGLQCGPMRMGLRNGDEAILMMSGPGTELIAWEPGFPEVRATRVDIQATFRLRGPDETVARRSYEAMAIANGVSDRQKAIKLVESPTGSTFYLNRRTADCMIRLYDASHKYEPFELGRYWRVEVEYKRKKANAALEKWISAEDKYAFCIRQTLGEALTRGLNVGIPDHHPIDAISVKTEVTTIQGKLTWLSKTVAPVVAQLTLMGYTEECLEAMGLKSIAVAIDRRLSNGS